MSDIFVNNPPAFPQTIDDMGTLGVGNQGMTLRDYFAAAALKGMLASPNLRIQQTYKEIGDECYKFADSLLTIRDEGKSI